MRSRSHPGTPGGAPVANHKCICQVECETCRPVIQNIMASLFSAISRSVRVDVLRYMNTGT